MSTLEVKTSDTTEVKDNLSTWKKWFNGIKHFYTVKSLPPKR